MKCIHCGKTVADEARFCKYCGTRLRRTCAECGAALDEDARFCSACGAEALAELDFSKALTDLAAADAAPVAGRQNNTGFYFSRRISRSVRGAADNAFDICGNRLAFIEDQKLNLLTQGQTVTRRRTDVSLDNAVMALAIAGEDIYAAGFDWAKGSDPTVMLWKYDQALNLRTAEEVLRLGPGSDRRACKMRLTDRHLFLFLWDNHDAGKRDIIKYDIATGRLVRKQLGGKRADLWYVDGEKIYFRGERTGETFFGVLDTAPQVWTIRRVWTIGDGAGQVPDGPVYCNFLRGIAWTYATAEERAALKCDGTSLVARALAPGHALVSGCPVWQSQDAGAVNLFFDYFDGLNCFKANNVLAMDAYDVNAVKHRWKNTLHGDTENILVWGDKLLADFTGHGYRIYFTAIDGPEDVVQDGIAVRDL